MRRAVHRLLPGWKRLEREHGARALLIQLTAVWIAIDIARTRQDLLLPVVRLLILLLGIIGIAVSRLARAITGAVLRLLRRRVRLLGILVARHAPLCHRRRARRCRAGQHHGSV